MGSFAVWIDVFDSYEIGERILFTSLATCLGSLSNHTCSHFGALYPKKRKLFYFGHSMKG
jgi:hypothetical protein